MLLMGQLSGNSRANQLRHWSAVQAAFSLTAGLPLGFFARFSTVNPGHSGIVVATSQYGGGNSPLCFARWNQRVALR